MKKMMKDTILKLLVLFFGIMILITGHVFIVDRIYRYHYDLRYSTVLLNNNNKDIQLKE